MSPESTPIAGISTATGVDLARLIGWAGGAGTLLGDETVGSDGTDVTEVTDGLDGTAPKPDTDGTADICESLG